MSLAAATVLALVLVGIAILTGLAGYWGVSVREREPRAARVAISAKLVANMVEAAGVDRVVTVDLHADQIQGFFNVPVDNVYASPLLLGDVWRHKYPDPLVVSPDVGGVVRARALAKRLDDAELAIIDKRRPQPNQAEVPRSPFLFQVVTGCRYIFRFHCLPEKLLWKNCQYRNL